MALELIANRIYQDSVGAAFWDSDKQRLEDYEFGEYCFGTYPHYETYEVTSREECDKILEALFEWCDMCASCSWIWWVEDMEEVNGDLVCTQCNEEEEE